MKLESPATNQTLILTPLGYEFPDGNDSWIVLEGVVTTLDEEWTFRDPALVVREIATLIEWLKVASRGDLVPTGAKDEPGLSFVEPCIGFSVKACSAHSVTLRVHLWCEAAPPRTFRPSINREGEPFLKKTSREFALELTMTPAALLRAADELQAEASWFPQRASDY